MGSHWHLRYSKHRWAHGPKGHPSKQRDVDDNKSRDISGRVGIGSGSEVYLTSYLLMLAHGIQNEVGDAGGLGGVKGKSVSTVAMVIPSQQRYECSVCGKVYLCYQALGGHMTRHHKLLVQVAAGDESSSNRSKAARVHKCSICLLTFSSRHVLGGHKQIHYESGVARDSIKEKNIMKIKAMRAPKAVLKDFDLNLPAMETTVGDEANSSPPEAKRARMLLLP